MKKLILFMLLVACNMLAIAQNNLIIQVDTLNGGTINVCVEENIENAVIYAQEGCEDFYWVAGGSYVYDNPLIVNLQGYHEDDYFDIWYYGCSNFHRHFYFYFWETHVPSPLTCTIWKREGFPLEIDPDSLGYMQYSWSTGEITNTIEVTEPGTYTCNISDNCGSITRTFIVRNNVEMSLATCDLETNHNMVTWPTTPEQAEYISTVKVKRDGIDVGTAPYTDGYFTDNIGSDAASRTYTVVGITPEGEECPITSYPKETIHMAYLTGINNTIEVNWNIPTGYDLLGYNICEWNPDNKDGDLTVIDFVGAGVTSYTCSENQFDHGMVVVQGVENGRPESRLLSNRSWETVGIGEHTKQNFKIFPNPTNGSFTVEGTPTVTVYNILGQTVITNHSENGTHTFTLRPGIYTVRNSDGLVRKVVVE